MLVFLVEYNEECYFVVAVVGEMQTSSMKAYYLFCNGKAYARTVIFCGEEWCKNVFDDLGGNISSGIAYFDVDAFVIGYVRT